MLGGFWEEWCFDVFFSVPYSSVRTLQLSKLLIPLWLLSFSRHVALHLSDIALLQTRVRTVAPHRVHQGFCPGSLFFMSGWVFDEAACLFVFGFWVWQLEVTSFTGITKHQQD
jgi:hypothetical protein